MTCAREFATQAVNDGAIRRKCRSELVRAAKRSTCAREEEAVTCCKTSKNGTSSCKIAAKASKCEPTQRRFAEIGETDSCLDACAGLAGPLCITDLECDDGNACTVDSCDPTAGCSNVLDAFCDPSGGGGTACTGTGAATHGLSSMERHLLDLMNDYRGTQANLAACNSLNVAAQDHANDMRDEEYYSHKGKNGSEFWERACDAGYQAGCGPTTWMGEIITGWASTPEEAFQMWRNSPGHDALMKDGTYSVAGVGHACGGPLGHYWVVDFAAANEASCN